MRPMMWNVHLAWHPQFDVSHGVHKALREVKFDYNAYRSIWAPQLNRAWWTLQLLVLP